MGQRACRSGSRADQRRREGREGENRSRVLSDEDGSTPPVPTLDEPDRDHGRSRPRDGSTREALGWRHDDLRWVLVGVLEAARGCRRLKGDKDMKDFVARLEQHGEAAAVQPTAVDAKRAAASPSSIKTSRHQGKRTPSRPASLTLRQVDDPSHRRRGPEHLGKLRRAVELVHRRF